MHITRPALEGGQGRPWPPQLFITPSTIEKIKLSEIIRVIVADSSCSTTFHDPFHPPIRFVFKTADWIQNSLLPAEFV